MSKMKSRLIATLALAGMVDFSLQSAMAETWSGHLATLQDAKVACQDIDSAPCLPYLAQAVSVADTLTAQAVYDSKRDDFKIPGRDGSIWICDPSFLKRLNGQDLLYLALAQEPSDGKDVFYWDDALFVSALNLCRIQPAS